MEYRNILIKRLFSEVKRAVKLDNIVQKMMLKDISTMNLIN